MATGVPVAVPWYENESSYLAMRDMLPASERLDPFTFDVFMSRLKAMEDGVKAAVMSPIVIEVATKQIYNPAQPCHQNW